MNDAQENAIALTPESLDQVEKLLQDPPPFNEALPEAIEKSREGKMAIPARRRQPRK